MSLLKKFHILITLNVKPNFLQSNLHLFFTNLYALPLNTYSRSILEIISYYSQQLPLETISCDSRQSVVEFVSYIMAECQLAYMETLRPNSIRAEPIFSCGA